MRTRAIKAAVLVCLAMAVMGSLAFAQRRSGGTQQPMRRGRAGDPAGFGRGLPDRMDAAQMQQRMQQMMSMRLRNNLGVSDAQWKEMEPKLTEVIELKRQLEGNRGMTAGARGGMFGGARGGMAGGRGGMRGRPANSQTSPDDRELRGRRGPGRQAMPDRDEMTPLEKSRQDLQEALQDDAATAEQVKAKLATFRTARENVKQQLAKAQAELKQGLTVEQEANLVLIGVLD